MEDFDTKLRNSRLWMRYVRKATTMKWRIVLVVEDNGHTESCWAGGAADVQVDVEQHYDDQQIIDSLNLGDLRGVKFKVESCELDLAHGRA